MGWLSVAIAVVAAFLLKGSGGPALFWSAVAIALVTFWTWGVMYNVAKRAAVNRTTRIIDNMKAEGRSPEDITRVSQGFNSMTAADANLAPNWATNLNMLGTLGAIILLVWAVVLRVL